MEFKEFDRKLSTTCPPVCLLGICQLQNYGRDHKVSSCTLWTCTYILLPLTGIRSLHKTQGEAQTWPQAVSHHSVSSPSTRISFYEAFRNTNCRKTNNCNNCCPRSDLKLQSKMVSQNSHTTAFIFGKKNKIILLRRLWGAPVPESRLNIHIQDNTYHFISKKSSWEPSKAKH